MSFNYNQPFGGFGGYVPPVQNPVYQQPQPPQYTTNKLYVASVQDAITRYAMPNTVILYTLQDESAVIEVTTDAQGKKTPRVRLLSDEPVQTAPPEYVSRQEFDAFRAEVQKLISPNTEGGVNNGTV